ncbi:MAG: hypothetical protein GC159_24180 [Phycisphaera sp.]|nr:hypothetical protein [Phycisphaera sp.]
MSRSDHTSKRRVTYLDAWGAVFSPRWPLIQRVCEMSDAEALGEMRALGLLECGSQGKSADGDPTLFDPAADDKTPADSAGAKGMEVA